MPLYEYQCRRCEVRTEVFQRRMDTPREAVCEACGSRDLERAYAPFATYRSELDKLRELDPKYYRQVDRAIAATPEADPMRHLKRLRSFDSASEPGEPIRF
ncbi:MAG TPA: zinc ribbon domain-containing protein [Chloroflexota bacterium]|nr:zinc ribbon domain-containing protein [Chloroflexota bacterium]